MAGVATGVFSSTCSPAPVSTFWDQLQDPVAKSAKLEGVSLDFASSPPLSAAPPCSVSRNPSKKQEIIRQVEDLVDSGRVSEVPLSSIGFWGHVFLVEQPNKMRLILDLSPLNKFLNIPSFQMVSMPEILKMISPGDWMTSVDIEKAYWQVPIHPHFRKFFQFRIDDKGFQFQVMPFGLSTAPFWFTTVIKPIIAFLSKQGIKVTSYIDGLFYLRLS